MDELFEDIAEYVEQKIMEEDEAKNVMNSLLPRLTQIESEVLAHVDLGASPEWICEHYNRTRDWYYKVIGRIQAKALEVNYE